MSLQQEPDLRRNMDDRGEEILATLKRHLCLVEQHG